MSASSDFTEKATSEVRIQTLQGIIETLKHELKESAEENTRYKEIIRRKDEKISSIKTELNEEIENLKVETSRKIQDYQKQIKSKDEKIESLIQSVESKKKKVDKLQKELEEKNSQFKSWKKLDLSTESINDEISIPQVKKCISLYKIKNSSLKNKLNSLETDNELMETQLKKVGELKKIMEERNQESVFSRIFGSKAEADVTKLLQSIDDIQNSMISKKLKDLSDTQEKLEEEYRKLKEKETEFQERIESSQIQYDKFQLMLNNLKKENEQLKRKGEVPDSTEEKNKIQELNNMLQLRTEACDKLRNKISSLEKDKENLIKETSKKGDSSRMQSFLELEFDQLVLKHQNLEQHCSHLQTELDKCQKPKIIMKSVMIQTDISEQVHLSAKSPEVEVENSPKCSSLHAEPTEEQLVDNEHNICPNCSCLFQADKIEEHFMNCIQDN